MKKEILPTLFVFLCLSHLALVAQPLKHVPFDSLHSFIHYESNQLHIGKDSSLANAFFDKWLRVAETGKGCVNIVHIGSSHVQAGIFPNKVRTNLMKAYPNLVGGRGMTFPYSAAKKCNNPPDYVVHCKEPMELCRCVYNPPSKELGLCGIAVTARDTTACIDIALRNEGIDYKTNQVVLMGYLSDSLPRDSDFVPLINYDGRDITPSYVDPATRRYVFNLARNIDSFRIVLPCNGGRAFTLTGLCLGNRDNGFTYHSIGVNGASLKDYLDKCPYFTRDLRLLRPDMVIFGIGINDAHGPTFDSATFHAKYRQLADSVRSTNPNCFFIFVTNNDSYRRVGRSYAANERALEVREVMFHLAEETHGAVWDQFEIMGGLKSMNLWRNAKLGQKDRIHFTHAGYELLGNLLTNALFDAANHRLTNRRPGDLDRTKIEDTNQNAGSYYLSY
ncbi:MAG: GDSL-type esterase/lipase family protein [Bacteroidales bacterium]|nr:GDSL-type esterase/lipase family protein [Bacteroidales bacterium]